MNNKIVNIAAMLILTQIGTLPVLAASPVGSPTPLDKKLSAAAVTGTQTAKSSVQITSVLERFRTYSGPRTPAALVALFAAPVTAATIHQHPEVALSDGASIVKITVDAGPQENKSPNIAFNEAKLISLKQNKPGKWDIEALPDGGTWNVSLILLTGSDSRTVPLTVAPILPAGTDLSERGFITFLGGAKAASQPLQDLNGDGRRDYLDDYIFTANYLARPNSATAGSDSGQTPEAQHPVTTQKSDIQYSDDRQSSELQGSGVKQNSEPQEIESSQGSNSVQTATPQPVPGGTGIEMPPVPVAPTVTAPVTPSVIAPTVAPTQTEPTSTPTTDPSPLPEPVPAPEIQLDTTPDRHNLINRNERARKIKELLQPSPTTN